MKKKVTFEKQIDFPTMIGEISAISLEPNLRFIDQSNVEGELLLNGKYKLTEASRLEEDFYYQIPIEIAFQEKIDLDTATIEISDFTYEIENNDTMICHIELFIEGLEFIEEEEIRECDDNPSSKEIEIPKIDGAESDDMEEMNHPVREEEKMEEHMKDKVLVEEEDEKKSEEKEIQESLFLNFKEENETYGTFLVYMVRQNESIQSIISKYHTTLEEVEKYNDLTHIDIGSKIIIPLMHD